MLIMDAFSDRGPRLVSKLSEASSGTKVDVEIFGASGLGSIRPLNSASRASGSWHSKLMPSSTRGLICSVSYLMCLFRSTGGMRFLHRFMIVLKVFCSWSDLDMVREL